MLLLKSNKKKEHIHYKVITKKPPLNSNKATNTQNLKRKTGIKQIKSYKTLKKRKEGIISPHIVITYRITIKHITYIEKKHIVYITVY